MKGKAPFSETGMSLANTPLILTSVDPNEASTAARELRSKAPYIGIYRTDTAAFSR
jgi:F420-0:gamma-glutamyl ligase-like protein